MKFLNISLSLLMILGVIACDPLSDYRDDMDDTITADDDYLAHISTRSELTEATAHTLTDEDYELSSVESVANFKSFSDAAPMEEHLPEIIDAAYYAEAGSLIEINYDFFNGSTTETLSTLATFIKSDLAWSVVPNFTFTETEKEETKEYTITSADYKLTETYENYSGPHEEVLAKIEDVLKLHFILDFEEGDVYKVNYNYYDGSTSPTSVNLEIGISE